MLENILLDSYTKPSKILQVKLSCPGSAKTQGQHVGFFFYLFLATTSIARPSPPIKTQFSEKESFAIFSQKWGADAPKPQSKRRALDPFIPAGRARQKEFCQL